MDGFIDTAVVIDIYRGHAPAISWLRDNPSLLLGMTPIVWMECVTGASDKSSQSKITRLLSQFPIVYPTQADMEWAMRQLQIFRLSHNVGILDCLIAAPSYRLGLPLVTRNLKHFTPILGDLAQQPY